MSSNLLKSSGLSKNSCSQRRARALDRAGACQLLVAALIMAAPIAAAVAADPIAFNASYHGGDGHGCNLPRKILGAEPNDGLTHPVFIYTVGTWERYDDLAAQTMVMRMAQRGYVAATVQYANETMGNCDQIGARAQCIFDAGQAQSAVAVLCQRASADCSKGIVTSGFSQGSVVATLAHNYNNNVRATYGIGDGVRYMTYNLNACMAAGQYTLPVENLRVVNGIHDQFLGPTSKGSYGQSNKVTGMDCPEGSLSCLRDNGSGWVIVQNDQVQDGLAEHCYQYVRSGHDSCPMSQDFLDQGWLYGTDPWQLNANLDWLAGFAGP